MFRLQFYIYFCCILGIFLSACTATGPGPGHSFLKQGQYDAAIDAFQEALQNTPNDNRLWRDLGIAWHRKGQADSALQALQKAYQLNPKDGSTLYFLGEIYEAEGNYGRALHYYRGYANISSFKKIRSKLKARFAYLAERQLAAATDSAIAVETQIDSENIPENTIGVLPFRNHGPDRNMDPLGAGLAEIISYDLGKIDRLRVLERVRTNVLQRELDLVKDSLVALNSAARMGRQLRARTLVQGNFGSLDASSFHIYAGLINTPEGRLTESGAASGELANFLRVGKELALSLLDKLGIVLSEEERAAILEVPTNDLAAFIAFGEGVQHQDEWRFKEAAIAFRRAASLDPGFSMATEKAVESEAMENASAGVEQLGDAVFEEEVIKSVENAGGNQAGLSRLQASADMISAGSLPGKDQRQPVQEESGANGVQVPVQIEIGNSGSQR